MISIPPMNIRIRMRMISLVHYLCPSWQYNMSLSYGSIILIRKYFKYHTFNHDHACMLSCCYHILSDTCRTLKIVTHDNTLLCMYCINKHIHKITAYMIYLVTQNRFHNNLVREKGLLKKHYTWHILLKTTLLFFLLVNKIVLIIRNRQEPKYMGHVQEQC